MTTDGDTATGLTGYAVLGAQLTGIVLGCRGREQRAEDVRRQLKAVEQSATELAKQLTGERLKGTR